MNVSISICPTSLEFGNGDRFDEDRLLAAIRRYVLSRHPLASITCLQVGHRQGDAWARVDGDSETGEALLASFFDDHGADGVLFAAGAPPTGE